MFCLYPSTLYDFPVAVKVAVVNIPQEAAVKVTSSACIRYIFFTPLTGIAQLTAMFEPNLFKQVFPILFLLIEKGAGLIPNPFYMLITYPIMHELLTTTAFSRVKPALRQQQTRSESSSYVI